MAETVQTIATNDYPSVALPVAGPPKTFTYDGAGNVTTISVEYNTVVYTMTFTYSGANVTDISGWMPPS